MFIFFKKYDAHLCSAVAGQVLLNGEPLAGVKVERELYYIDDKKRFDSVLTDEQGRFKLPVVNVRSKAPGWLFAEQLTKQEINVEYENKSYLLWAATLWGSEPVKAYSNKLACLIADLSSPKASFTFNNDECATNAHCAISICRWDKDFEMIRVIK